MSTAPGPLLLLARHGPTSGNQAANPKIRGWKDAPLTPEGRLEVQLAAQKMKPYRPQAIYHSDFMRDTETAMLLAEQLGIAQVEADYNVRTWDTGQYSGQLEADVRGAIQAHYDHPWEPAPGGSESLTDFYDRWYGFLDSKLQAAAEIEAMRPLLIVTHGRNLAAAHSYFEFVSQASALMPYPAGFAVVSVYPDRSLHLDFVGPTEPIQKDV